MTDQTAGDMPWQTSPIGLTPTAPIRPPRQKRHARAAAKPKVRKPREPKPPAEALVVPARKSREPKAERAAPETVKISIRDYAEMRVTAFQREFVKLHKILAPISAKARNQIIAELQKVFG